MLKKKEAFRRWMVILATVLLIAGIFVSGVLDRQKVWTEMTYHDILTFSKPHPTLFSGSDLFERVTYSLEDGDAYGMLNEGPGFDLPAGRYRIKYRVDADGSNAVHISAGNDAKIEPNVIALHPDEWEGEAWIELKEDAIDLQIQFEFQSGTTMRVDDLRLYSPEYRDDTFTAALLLAALGLIYILYSWRKISGEDLGSMVIIGLAVLVCSAPAFKENMILSHDSTFHMARVMNLADGLAHGQFPVRLGGFTHNGYGALTSVFYPDLLLYPFAMLINGGATITYVMNLICVAVNIVSAAAMYACARRIFGSRETGVCASVLYVLSTYRVVNLYSRCAMGEMWAMAVLPLFVLGMWEVLFGDKDRWPVLAAGAALVYLSHLLTTVLCALGAAGVCVLCARRLMKEGRFWALIKAAAFALAMGMYTLVPFLMYSSQGIGAQGILGSNTLHMLSPAQLFLWGEGDMVIDPKDTQLAGQSFEIGIPLLVGVAALLYMRAVRPARDQKENHALFFAFVGLASAFVTTRMFPWSHLDKLTAGYVNYLQFPWRFLLVVSVMLSLGCGYAYMRLAEEKKELVTFAVLALAVVMVLPTITREAHSDDYVEFGEGASPYIQYSEYMLPGSNIFDTFDRSVHTQGDVEVMDYRKDSTTVTAQIRAQEGGLVSVPLFGYDGYRAQIGGKEAEWSLGENQRIVVHVPAGASGEMKIWFGGKPIWRAADAVSLLAALVLACMCVRRKRR